MWRIDELLQRLNDGNNMINQYKWLVLGKGVFDGFSWQGAGSKPYVGPVPDIEIEADPGDIRPWISQFGYHPGDWYIDTWWDKFEQNYF